MFDRHERDTRPAIMLKYDRISNVDQKARVSGHRQNLRTEFCNANQKRKEMNEYARGIIKMASKINCILSPTAMDVTRNLSAQIEQSRIK